MRRNILFILVIIIIFVLLYRKNYEHFYYYGPRICQNCGHHNARSCMSCVNCGLCVPYNGTAECIPGNFNGPYFRDDCIYWKYGNKTMTPYTSKYLF